MMKTMSMRLGTALLGLLLTLTAATPSAHADEKKLKIADIIFQDDQFFRLVMFGAHDAAKRLDVDLRDGNSQNKLDKEAQLVDTYVTAKFDAILISPLSKKASAETIKHARDKGLVVVVHNTTVEGGYENASVEFDDRDIGRQLGQAAAEYIKDKLGGKAKVAVLQFKSQVPEQSAARTEGFLEPLKAMPGVEVVADQDAWLAEQGMAKTRDILTAHPDLNVIFAANEGGMVGATLGVKTSGKAGKVGVFGIGASEQILSFLKSSDDILQAASTPPPFEAGQKALETAVKILRHEPVEKQIILKGTLLTRTKPAELDAYSKQLKQWMSGE